MVDQDELLGPVEQNPARRLFLGENLFGQDLLVGIERVVLVPIEHRALRDVLRDGKRPELSAAVRPRDLPGEREGRSILEFEGFRSEGISENREQAAEPSLPQCLAFNQIALTVNRLKWTR